MRFSSVSEGLRIVSGIFRVVRLVSIEFQKQFREFQRLLGIFRGFNGLQVGLKRTSCLFLGIALKRNERQFSLKRFWRHLKPTRSLLFSHYKPMELLC